MTDLLFWDADLLSGAPAGVVTADCVTSWEPEKTAEVTSHPIETGSEVSDHVIHRPDELSVEFAQSELAFRDDELEWQKIENEVRQSEFRPEGLLFLTMGAGMLIDAAAGALGLSSNSQVEIWALTAKEDRDRVLEVYDAIAGAIDSARLVKFSLKGQVLDGYVLTSLRLRRQGGRESGLARISVRARHVQTVETSASSLLGGFPVPSALRALPLLPFGKKGTSAIVADVEEHASTALGIGSLGEFL
jgi:hypothetical protein